MSVDSLAAQVAPPERLLFRRDVRLTTALREVWGARELVRTLAERDYRVRYKQAFLGVAWAVVTPLALMVVFTLVFQRVAHIKHGNVPYPLFSYCGLIPWAFFSNSISSGGLSLVSNVPLLNKVYCPREVFPIGAIIVAGIDALMSTVGLVVLFLVYWQAPTATIIYAPAVFVVQMMLTLGLTLMFSVVIVHFRDMRYALPIILQLGLFATPVAYGLDDIPSSVRAVYVLLNPLAAVIDGYRRSIVLGQQPEWTYLGIALLSSTVVLVLGYRVFKKLETGIADVA